MKRFKLIGALLAVGVWSESAMSQEVIFNNIPGVLAPNYSSLGYQATSTSELGDLIHFGGTSRTLQSATVTMSNWALQSTYANSALWNTAGGFTIPITFNIYNVGNGTTPGALLATRTQDQFIKWRPEHSVECPGQAFAAEGSCWNGLAQNIDFDFTGTVVPDDIIFGIAFNTNTWGYSPYNAPGPYESLNVGLDPTLTVGTDVNTNELYWGTKYPGYTGVFSADKDWSPSSPMVRFTASTTVPEPSTYMLMIAGLAGVFGVRRRQTRRAGTAQLC